MNKKLISLCLFFTITSNASNFIVLIEEKNNKYLKDQGLEKVSYTDWTPTESKTCSYDKVKSDYYYGVDFTQVETCIEPQSRIKTTKRIYKNDNEVLVSTELENRNFEETFQNNLVGTHIESTCENILNNGYSHGDGEYRISYFGDSTVYCDMTRSGGGWMLLEGYDWNEDQNHYPSNMVKTVNRTITSYTGASFTFENGWYIPDSRPTVGAFDWTEVSFPTNGFTWKQTMIDIDPIYAISVDSYNVISSTRDSVSVNGQYLDGVSLTYGEQGSRQPLLSLTPTTSGVDRITWLNNTDSNLNNNYSTLSHIGSNAFVSGVKISGTEKISARFMVNQNYVDEQVGFKILKVWVK